MFRHVVLFKWIDGTDDARVAEVTAALRALPEVVPTIRAYAVGAAVSGSHDFAIVADFDDEAGWRVYDEHPDHVRVRDELILPMAVDRAAVRYEV